MSIIFEIEDKTGRKIHLTKERWTHITSPSSLHAYMTNYLEEIKQTLTQPYKILTSSIEDKKVNHYRYFKEKNIYLKAIVKYLNGKGFVISAHFINTIR